MLIFAGVLLRVTMVGLLTIFVLCDCCNALRTRLKSLAVNTAESRRFVPSLLVSEFSVLNTLVVVLVPVVVVPTETVVVLSEVRAPVVPVVEVAVGVPLAEVMVALELEPLVWP